MVEMPSVLQAVARVSLRLRALVADTAARGRGTSGEGGRSDRPESSAEDDRYGSEARDVKSLPTEERLGGEKLLHRTGGLLDYYGKPSRKPS